MQHGAYTPGDKVRLKASVAKDYELILNERGIAPDDILQVAVAFNCKVNLKPLNDAFDDIFGSWEEYPLQFYENEVEIAVPKLLN